LTGNLSTFGRDLPRLDALTALVVDANEASGRHLRDTLRRLGIGTAVCHARAVDALIDLQRGGLPRPEGPRRPPDLLFAALADKPLDGLTLLLWIRRHRESPDPFVPVVLTTSEPTRSDLAAVRAAGGHGLLSIRFSTAQVERVLFDLTARRRPWVFARRYFGPDRRRQGVPPGHEDRRLDGGTVPSEGPDHLVDWLPIDLPSRLGVGGETCVAAQYREFDLLIERVRRKGLWTRGDWQSLFQPRINRLRKLLEGLPASRDEAWHRSMRLVAEGAANVAELATAVQERELAAIAGALVTESRRRTGDRPASELR